MNISIYNGERYIDTVPYEALVKIEKEQRAKNYRPLAYICSPYSGDVEKNTANAQRYCKFALDNHAIPIAPHLLFTQFMDDNNPKERNLALFMGLVLLGKCKEVWVFGDTISEGMRKELDKAKRWNKRIRYFDEDLKEVTR